MRTRVDMISSKMFFQNMYIMDRETNIVSKETCGMKKSEGQNKCPWPEKEYAKSLSLHIWENHLNANNNL